MGRVPPAARPSFGSELGRRRLHRPGPAGGVDGPAGRPVGGDASAPPHVPLPRLGSAPVPPGPPPGRLRTLAEAPSGGRGLRVVPGGLRAAGAVAAVVVARTRRAIAGSNDAGRRGGAPIPRLRPVAVRATARCGERTRPEAGSPP